MENDKFLDPFVGDSASVAYSQSGRRKIALKLAHENRGIKKLRENPDTFDNLMKVVAVHTKDPAASKVNYQIEYTDDCGDVIAVSDDEDLAAAYEWAQDQPTANLKLQIKEKLASRKKSFEEDVQKKVIEPFAAMKLEDQPKAAQPQEDDSSSSDSDGVKPANGMMHAAIGIPSLGAEKNQKKLRKHQKAIKKMLKKSMMQNTKELIHSIMEEESKKILGDNSSTMETAGSGQIDTQVSEKVGAEEVKTSDPLRQSVHNHVECDSCGVVPILGARYKCTVCKDFDYCEKCEQTKGHPHAFLKINNPDQAPRAMFTVVNEDMPNVQNVDGEVDEITRNFGRGGPFARGWRKWGRGGHHGHGHGHGPHSQSPHGHGPHGGPHGPHGGPPGPHHFPGAGHNLGSGMGNPDQFAKKMEDWGKCMGEWGAKMAEAHKDGNTEGGMDPEIMKKKVGWFMRNMFNGCKGKGEGEASKWKCGGWNKKGGNGNGGRMNPCRAVAQKLPEMVSACAGDLIEVEVTFCNDTQWPYKAGFHLENVAENSDIGVEPIKVAIAEIAGKTHYTVKIPIKINEGFESCVRADVDFYTLAIGITNAHGCKVGTEALIKIRVIEKIDEMQLYDKVMQLEAFMATGTTAGADKKPLDFDEAVAALKDGDYDVNRAYEILSQKALMKSVQPDLVDDEGDNLYD